MGNRDVDTPFPENLRDPMHAQSAAMRLQDLFLILSQCVDLGLFTITAAFKSCRRPHRALRSRPRPRIRPRGEMEYWSVGCCPNSQLHPRSGLGMLKKILGSRFEIIRINQCESLGPLGVR